MPCSSAAAITSCVAHRAARLNHRRDAVGGGDIDAVAKRKERIRCHDRAAQLELFIGRLERRDAASSTRGSSARRRRRRWRRRARTRWRWISRTCTTCQANSRSASSRASGWRRLTTLSSAGSTPRRVALLQQQAAGDACEIRAHRRCRRSRSPVSSTRRFGLAASAASASALTLGAAMTSANWRSMMRARGARVERRD